MISPLIWWISVNTSHWQPSVVPLPDISYAVQSEAAPAEVLYVDVEKLKVCPSCNPLKETILDDPLLFQMECHTLIGCFVMLTHVDTALRLRVVRQIR